MLFSWSEYDNPDPFDCVEDSFDNINDAKNALRNAAAIDEDGDAGLACVFDRVDGVFIK
jgi:hypothetical protein